VLTVEKRFVKSTELRPRAFESTAPRAMFESKREEVTGGWKSCIMKRSITCTPLQILLR
jgi:hypothetical protein